MGDDVSGRAAALARNILLSVVSTAIMLGALEAALRYTEVLPARGLERVTREEWDRLPGPFAPGQSYRSRFLVRVPYTVTVNTLGFRSPPARLRKTPGTFRILCLGDSYTFGAYVSDDETWPFLLQRRLSHDLPGRPSEVINAGVSSFTIMDELALLEEHGLDLEPDMVVLGVVLNDLPEMTRPRSAREAMKRAIEENARELLGPVKVPLRRTAIYTALLSLKARLLVLAGRAPTLPDVPPRRLVHPPYDAMTLGLFDRYRDELVKMKQLLDRRSIPLVVVIFPFWEQLAEGGTDEPQRRLDAIVAGLRIPIVDLLADFRSEDPSGASLFFMPRDEHPTPRAYRCTVTALASVLEALPALKNSSTFPPPRP